MVTIVQAPELDGDKHFGGKLPPHCRLERRIVANLINHLAAACFVPVAVDDGGERVKCNTAKEAMETIFSVDESHLIVGKLGAPKNHAILLIGGNGVDIVSDWNYTQGDPDGFNAVMAAFDSNLFA